LKLALSKLRCAVRVGDLTMSPRLQSHASLQVTDQICGHARIDRILFACHLYNMPFLT
jgi:hypothetical protein